MNLLLFDVDLTLINSGGAGRRSMVLAFEKLFGTRNGLDKVNFAGRTDILILKDALAHNDLQWSQDIQSDFKKLYLENLPVEIYKQSGDKHVEPGVIKLLNILLDQPDFKLGLLTGNWRDGAKIKLEYFHLFDFFELGVFADDAEIRADLPPISAEKFEDKFGMTILPEQVFIIGDTPLDIACAKPYGARSVGVATGSFSTKELRDAKPDFLFPDLTDHEAFLSIFDEVN